MRLARSGMAALACAAWLAPAAAQSVHVLTPIEGGACLTFNVYPGGADVVCPGPEGHSLIIEDNDLRVDVGLIAPGWDERVDIRLTPHFGASFRNLAGERVTWVMDESDPEQRARSLMAVVITSPGDGGASVESELVIGLDRPGPGEACVIFAAPSDDAARSRSLAAAEAPTRFDCLPPAY